MKPLKIACVGEAMVELSLTRIPGPGVIGIAGDTLNAAIYMRRALPQPHQVAFVSMIGSDPMSDQMQTFIDREGVSTETLGRDPDHLPGIYAVNTDAAGERSFLYWRENSAARRLFQVGGHISFDVLDGFDVIYFSAITLAILPRRVREGLFDWIARFRAAGGRFAFDSNYRPRLWDSRQEAQHWVEQAWRHCDIALPSIDDELALFGDTSEAAILARFADYSIPVGVLKRAERGPTAIPPSYAPAAPYAPAPIVVDTTAAGDSFVGTFLAHHLTGASLPDAMLAAHTCSATVVGHKGAIVPVETLN